MLGKIFGLLGLIMLLGFAGSSVKIFLWIWAAGILAVSLIGGFLFYKFQLFLSFLVNLIAPEDNPADMFDDELEK